MTSYFEAPNSTPIPNVLFDVLMRDMTEYELRVVMAILRINGDFSQSVTFDQLVTITGLTLNEVKAGFRMLCGRGIVSPAVIMEVAHD